MIPPTSPGADSTPVERREDVADLVEFLADIDCPDSADLVEDLWADCEALRAALLRTQQHTDVVRDGHQATIAKQGASLAALRAERDALATALREWWASKRPVGWTVEQHAANPTVNCVTEAEKRLARALHPHPETPSHE